MGQKTLIVQASDATTDIQISFFRTEDGYVHASVAIGKEIGGQRLLDKDVTTMNINDVPYTISNVTPNKVRQILRDIRNYAETLLGYT